MAFLSAALPYIGLATTALQGVSQYQQGKTDAAQLELEATRRDRSANAEQAESQREAAVERRKAQNMMSRARALAAASGGGVSNPTISAVLTDIETQGEVNALNALYSGNVAAEGYRSGAGAARRESRASRDAGTLNAASTILGGATSWYSKYGGTRGYGTKPSSVDYVTTTPKYKVEEIDMPRMARR
jgi:hypothetical protein